MPSGACVLSWAGAGWPLGPAQAQLFPQTAQPATTPCTRSSTCSTPTPTGTPAPSGDSATWYERPTSTSPGEGGPGARSGRFLRAGHSLLHDGDGGRGEDEEGGLPAQAGGAGVLGGLPTTLCMGRGHPDSAWCEQPPLPVSGPSPQVCPPVPGPRHVHVPRQRAAREHGRGAGKGGGGHLRPQPGPRAAVLPGSARQARRPQAQAASPGPRLDSHHGYGPGPRSRAVGSLHGDRVTDACPHLLGPAQVGRGKAVAEVQSHQGTKASKPHGAGPGLEHAGEGQAAMSERDPCMRGAG